MTQDERLAIAQDLIYLLSCAVNDQNPDPERCADMDMDAVFQMARAHKLAAMAAYALKQTKPLTQDWLEALAKAARNCVLYNVEREKILQAMDDEGIWYLPLKGILLKEYYPNPMLREMADNDILCDKTRMNDVRSIMTRLDFTCSLYGKGIHDKYQKPPLSFEMHRELFSHYRIPAIASYYRSIQQKLLRDEGNRCGYHLSDEDFYLYILCHMYKHYVKSGTGLRSLLDIYVFYQKKEKQLDRAYLDTELDRLGIKDFEQDSRILAEKVFSAHDLTEEEKERLDEFVFLGCYGNTSYRVENGIKMAGGKKSRYILRRCFPDTMYLKSYYPTVYRHRILYPLLIPYRPVKALITKRKKLFREVRSLKEYKKKGNQK